MNIKNASGIAGGLLVGFCLGGVLWAKAAPPAEAPLTAAENKEIKQHTAWVQKTFERIITVKPGNTRADLLKTFANEGGLSSSTHRTYVCRTCPTIKVDVDFRIVGRPERDADGRIAPDEDSRDVITKISRPYLDWSVID